MRLLLTIVLLALPAREADAHAVWVAQRAGDLALVMGHGPEDLPYEAERVLRFSAHAADGATVALAARMRAGNLRAAWRPGIAAVVSEFHPGPWVKSANGSWRRGALASGESGQQYDYQRCGVHLFRPGVQQEALPECALRIVALDDPFRRGAGQTLRLRVELDDVATGGVPVHADYVGQPNVVSATTDQAGEATIVIRNEGVNVVVAALEGERAARVERAGREVLLVRSASLSFVLPFVHDGRLQDVFERRAAEAAD